MSDLNENKNNETESKKPTSPKSPKSPATPKVPTTPQSPVSQAVQSDHQAPQDLQASKPVSNSVANTAIETSKGITEEQLKNYPAPEFQVNNSGVAGDLELLKTPLETKSDDLQILDTKPGLVENGQLLGSVSSHEFNEETKNNKGTLSKKDQDLVDNAFENAFANQTDEKDISKKNVEAPAEELIFSKVLDPNERKHFQIIVKQQKESAGSLRRQVQALVAYIGTLPETEDSKALLESLSTL